MEDIKTTVAEAEQVPTGYKKCTKCGRVLPETEEYFYYKDRKTGKFSGICKSCIKCYEEINKDTIKARQKAYWEAHKEELKEKGKAYRDSHKEGVRKKNKAYWEAHKEELKEKNKAYCEAHKEVVRKKNKAYREAHKEVAKAYREAHKEELKEKNKAYCEAHKEVVRKKNKAYREAHKEEHKIYNQTRRARKKQLASTLTKLKWQATKTEFDNKCAYCGSSGKLTQDHFIPLSKGGGYTAANILPACPHCNSSKQANDFEDWFPRQNFYSQEREQHILDYVSHQQELEIAAA